MDLPSKLVNRGELVQDASEGSETFLLFAENAHQRDLGMIDPRAAVLDISVGNHDFTFKQNPTMLQSQRAGGTTGAAIWRLSPLLAEWLLSPENFLFKEGILGPNATLLELGSGVGGLLPVMLAPRIGRYIATDQGYALKLLQENIDANRIHTDHILSGPRKARRATARGYKIDLLALDWETDDAKSLLAANDAADGVDVVLASDCVYNYALIQPLVEACAEVCRMRSKCEGKPTLCIVAQQLRQPDVLEEWMNAFMQSFDTYRLLEDEIGSSLNPAAGYVVHIGTLRRPSEQS